MQNLAAYASDPQKSKGRLYPETRADFRDPFARDRDRIIHSRAFRRLMYKTQVFVAYEGDLFRTRLTHSLEVAQVARTIARRMRLNEDLAEVVALSHDLGHTPFGHTGEEALAHKMHDFGGYDHNAQALRVLTHLEARYPGFLGLNLTWETLEGIAKHNGPITGEIPWAMAALCQAFDLELSGHASLEAQSAAIADDIAYNHHDLQDGLRSGLLNIDAVYEIPIIKSALRRVDPQAKGKIRFYEALAIFFADMINDAYDQAWANINKNHIKSVEDVRSLGKSIVTFSDNFLHEINILRSFLFENLYRHQKIIEGRRVAYEIISRSFDGLMNNPAWLPEEWQATLKKPTQIEQARLVSDYLSGMTDRFISKQLYHIHGMRLP